MRAARPTTWRAIADGYIIITERTFKQFKAPDFQTFSWRRTAPPGDPRESPAPAGRRRGDAEPAAASSSASSRRSRSPTTSARASAALTGERGGRGGRRGSPRAALFFSAPLCPLHLAARRAVSSGMPDLWDDKLNAWILHWDFHQTFRDPLRLFDANIFFPARYTLAFSENLFGAALFGFPLYAAGALDAPRLQRPHAPRHDLSALAAWALAREMTGDAAASLLAGVVYAFVPWRIAQLPHVQFQWGAFLPLLLLFLLRYLEAGRRRDRASSGCSSRGTRRERPLRGLLGIPVAAVFLVALALRGGRRCAAAIVGRRSPRRPSRDPRRRSTALRPVSKLYGIERRRTRGVVLGPGRRLPDRRPAEQALRAAHAEVVARGRRFFPGLVPVALAALALRRSPARPVPVPAGGSEPPRRRAGGSRSGPRRRGVALLLVVWAAACCGPGSRRSAALRDPARLLVFATVAVLLRLLARVSRRARASRSSGTSCAAARSARGRSSSRLAASASSSRSASTRPFYRFLVQSLGSVFRSIRVPGRGIVLFDLALGVLAAWGLSLAAGSRPGFRRRAAFSARSS